MQPALEAAFISAGMSAIVALSVSLFSDRLKRWLSRPKLKITFDHDIDGCRIKQGDKTVIIRVKISNISTHPAINCRAVLFSVKRDSTKKMVLTDNPMMEWPHVGCIGLNIERTMDQFLNVAFSINNNNDNTHLHRFRFSTKFRPSQLDQFELEPESCEVGIALIADNLYRKDFYVNIVWSGAWDKLDAKPLHTDRV